MNEHSQIERLYTFLNDGCETLKPYTQKNTLKAFNRTVEFLLDDTLTIPVPEDVTRRMATLKEGILNETFERASMRKAMQLMLLKAFKDDRISNAVMTPDTIGYWFGYLLSKLYDTPPTLIFDPMVGTGNLLTTLQETFTEPITCVGVDDEPIFIETAQNFFDALNITHQLILQDTRTYQYEHYPAMVVDFPIHKKDAKEPYLPYHVLLQHLPNLKAGGFCLALIENDFFEQPEREAFQKALAPIAHLYGLIKLDDSLFKLHPKSVLILQKKHTETETLDDFLIADLPPFDEHEAFAKTLERIDAWFLKRKG